MKQEKIINTILEQLKQNEWKGKIVSMEHISELQIEIEEQHKKGRLDDLLYDEYLNRFDFKILDTFPDARSMIIVTAPQPQVRVTFMWKGQTHPCIIPSTYCMATDDQIEKSIKDVLIPQGYCLEKIRLPEKLLAVRSGLARYGKNNITYVTGIGSFHRLAVFVSDLSFAEDNWRDLKILKTCDGCTACMDACPTGAIVSNRFLVYAERCITFHNERQGEFPEWLDPSWHNCLVGCLYCQNACPMNQKLLNWIETGPTFSEEETAYIIDGMSQDQLADKTMETIETLHMTEYRDVMGRNLKAIIKKR